MKYAVAFRDRERVRREQRQARDGEPEIRPQERPESSRGTWEGERNRRHRRQYKHYETFT